MIFLSTTNVIKATIKSLRLTSVVALLCTISLPLIANERSLDSSKPPLPNPLSLQTALEMADPTHPDILMVDAQLKNAKANLLLVESQTGVKSYLDLVARKSQPTVTNEYISDSYARLVINKTIYDFGQSSALEDSLNARIDSQEHRLVDAQLQHQYDIMRRFYNVLLADFRYVVDDEEMTQRFLKYDKKRERHDLGMVSIVDLERAENYYREALSIRAASDKNQRTARLMLSIALNRSGELPSELTPPNLSYLTDELPEVDQLYQKALKYNPILLAAQKDVRAARVNIIAQRARYRPVLSAQLEISEYEQVRFSRDATSAQLLLRIPIYQSNETKAGIARASAQLSTRGAELKRLENQLLINISTLVKELNILKVKKQTAAQHLNFRDLDLEYRRALYELEVQTNMSERQAKLTEAQWQITKLNYEHALILAQLNILLGKPLLLPNSASPKEALLP